MDEASSSVGPSAPATVLVTGASRGIGLEFVRAFLERGARVIAGARNPTTASALSTLLEQHSEQLQVVQLDVADERSVSDMADTVGSLPINLLLNNAGILHVETLENMDVQNVLRQFQVNALGALMVTHALLPNLKEGSKVVNLTSRMGSLEDNNSGGYYGYRMSKAAMNMVTRSLAVDLKKRGITVVAMHPGMVQTDLTRGYGMMTAAESVAAMNQVIDQLSLEQTGQFLQYQGTSVPW
ncbi:MAG TPA: SDR family oxidoreductase [Pseudomonadota bacterium]|jgi:NAD(P)-dependent dehydrogenase (short-subunit alcohol dehydrogenase family)|nr:SDR family oxidoreductase [Pseudomonadota bacterium]